MTEDQINMAIEVVLVIRSCEKLMDDIFVMNKFKQKKEY